MTDIVDRIIAVRQAVGLNPTEFARRLGDKRQRVQDIERRKQRPPVDYIGKIVEHFRANAEWILTGKGEMFSGAWPVSPQPEEDMVCEPPAGSVYADSAKREQRLRRLQRLRDLERTVPELASGSGRQLTESQVRALVDFAYLYDLDEDGIRLLMTFLDY